MVSDENRSAAIELGQKVQFRLGRRLVTGTVTEDRGNIGSHGRRLLRVAVPMDPDEPSTFLVPMDDLHVVNENQESMESASSLDKPSVIEYLKEGGLISILQANSVGGKNQPRVWLCHDTLGNLTHTFAGERGIVGGEQIPFAAIWENKIFTPQINSVNRLLSSFGLSATESGEIIRSVGTAP